jgi:hypothetical protein
VRRLIATFIVFVLSAGIAGTSFAQSNDDRGHLWYIRGSFGAADQDLSEAEKAQNDQMQDLANLGLDISTYSSNFGQVWDYRVEVGAIIWNHFSLGLLFDYQPRGDDQSIAGANPSTPIRYAETIELNYYGWYGNITYWMPGVHGFFFSGRAGYGYGTFKESMTLNDASNPQNEVQGEGDYDGTGFNYGFSGGYQYTFVNGMLVYLELGYEWRDLGVFNGTMTTTNQTLFPDQSGNYTVNGEEVNWDFSGPFIALGLGFTGPY